MEGKDDPNSEALGTVQHPNKCEMNKKKYVKTNNRPLQTYQNFGSSTP